MKRPKRALSPERAIAASLDVSDEEYQRVISQALPVARECGGLFSVSSGAKSLLARAFLLTLRRAERAEIALGRTKP